jgi:hypothetical protein
LGAHIDHLRGPHHPADSRQRLFHGVLRDEHVVHVVLAIFVVVPSVGGHHEEDDDDDDDDEDDDDDDGMMLPWFSIMGDMMCLSS